MSALKRCTLGAAAGTISTFCVHVGDVVELRTEEQVLRVDARRVVAAVQHAQPIRNRSVNELPGNAMCATHTPVHAESSISFGVDERRPDPATVRPFDFRPKSLSEASFTALFREDRALYVAAFFGTTPRVAERYSVRVNRKSRFTDGTIKYDTTAHGNSPFRGPRARDVCASPGSLAEGG